MNPFWTVSLFWLAAAVCVIIALAFVLPALMRARVGTTKAARRDINIAVYQDQMKEVEADRANGLLSEAQFQTARRELETRLADDALSFEDTQEPTRVSSRKLGYSLAGVLPAAAFGLYFLLGNPTALITAAHANVAQPATSHAAATGSGGEHDIMKLIQQVEEKTKANPNDGEAWAILAKTYAAVGHWPEALHAYEKAIKLQPEKPSVMSGYAEALAISNNRVLAGKPMALILQALEKDPDDKKGLEMAGIAAFQEQGYAKAAFYMKRLHKLLPPESPYAQDILAAQQEAERLAKKGLTGLDSLNNPPPEKNLAASNAASPAIKASATIKGSIDIAPALKSKFTDKDVLFLFAKPGQSGPPVAAIRGNAGKFPVEFELNDSMAMDPGNKLTTHKEVSLTARISRTGDAKAQSGDLEGTLAAVKVGAKGVKLVINTVRP